MSDIRISLKHPVTAHGEEIRELVLRRPKVKDLRAIDSIKGEVAKVITLAADLAGVPPSTIDQVDAEDFAALAGALGGFFGMSPSTGGT